MTSLVPKFKKTNDHLFLLEGEAPGAPGLASSCCKKCERYTLGRVYICPHCFARELEFVASGQQAKLVESSIARHAAGGFEPPYAIGLIRTTEGLTIFSPLVGDTSRLAPGSDLRFVTLDRPGGQVGFAYEVGAA